MGRPIALALVVTLLFTGGSAATQITFTGDLDGPAVGTDSPATGEATDGSAWTDVRDLYRKEAR